MTLTATPLPTDTLAALELGSLNKTFGHGQNAVKVLHDVSLSLPTGEMVLLVGPSGCGKTTLISTATGILSADKGSQITLLGQPLHQFSRNQLSSFRQQKVGFVFQQFNLVETLSITQNVMIPLLIQRKPHAIAQAKAQVLLTQVGLGDKWQALPKQLSGGQQQRVAIARALSNDPYLVMCDEPTASLDSETGQQVMQLLKTIATSAGRCVIVVTHDTRIYRYADRIVTMEDGRITGNLTGAALTQFIQKGAP
jgi:putative ABC transport system ATP-binding protein